MNATLGGKKSPEAAKQRVFAAYVRDGRIRCPSDPSAAVAWGDSLAIVLDEIDEREKAGLPLHGLDKSKEMILGALAKLGLRPEDY